MQVFFYSLLRKAVTLFYKDIPHLLGFSFPARATTSVIIQNGKKILAVKISYKPGLSLPGGGVQNGESLEDAAKREVFEETGLKVSGLKYLLSSFSNDEYPAINVCFVGKAIGSLKSSVEGQPLWVTPSKNLEEFVFKDNRAALRKFQETNLKHQTNSKP